MDIFQCVPVSGQGFIPGAYKCFCEKGYYFPMVNLPSEEKYFSGNDLEHLYTNFSQNDSTNGADIDQYLSNYQCLKCAEV